MLEKSLPAAAKLASAAQASGSALQVGADANAVRRAKADEGEEALQRALYEVLQQNNTEVIKLHDGKRLIVATKAQYAPLKSFALLGWEGHDALYASGFVIPSCTLGRMGMQAAIDRISRQLPIPTVLTASPAVVKQRQQEVQALRPQSSNLASPAASKARISTPPCDETRMRVSIFYPKGRIGAEELSVELARAMVDVVKVKRANLPERQQTKIFDIDLREFR